jgi:magnesium transporter
VLITHDRVLILHIFATTKEDASHASSFMYGLQGKLQFGAVASHAALPYEFRALETILLMVTSELDIEYQDLIKPVHQVLKELENDVDLAKLKKLLDVSKQLSAFQQKVKLVRNALQTVLEADDDMAAMYLSEKVAGTPRAEADHEEIEMLLENYYEASGEIAEQSEKLLSDVDYTHDK